jgi:hypothetical protein
MGLRVGIRHRVRETQKLTNGLDKGQLEIDMILNDSSGFVTTQLTTGVTTTGATTTAQPAVATTVAATTMMQAELTS